MRERLGKKIGDVVGAFDRDVARRCALRERLLGVDAEVLLAAMDCLGSPDGAAQWLTGPEIGLSGETPVDVAATAEGKERVLNFLLRLERGMFAGPDEGTAATPAGRG